MPTIRRLHPLRDPADLDDVVALRVAWSAEQGRTGDESTLRTQVRDWLRSEGESRRLWAAYDGDHAVGFVSLFVYSRMPDVGRPQGRWGYVAQLYVRPDSRRRGIARELMAALTDHARKLDLARLVLHPSEMSRELYAALGFRRADELLLLPLR